MGNARTIHRSHTGSTPEQCRGARARALAFVFQCWQEKQEGAETALPKGSADVVMMKHEEVTYVEQPTR